METHYASYLSGFPAGGSTLMSCQTDIRLPGVIGPVPQPTLDKRVF